MSKRETRRTTGAGGKHGQSKVQAGGRQEPSGSAATTGAGGTATATLAITHEQIAERARLIWEQHGRPQGEDEQNWREAERQLKRELGID